MCEMTENEGVGRWVQSCNRRLRRKQLKKLLFLSKKVTSAAASSSSSTNPLSGMKGPRSFLAFFVSSKFAFWSGRSHLNCLPTKSIIYFRIASAT